MKRIRVVRLRKLADHLKNGKLGHDKFYFGEWHSEDSCGTKGCAAGECVFVWPESWEFRRGLTALYPSLIGRDLKVWQSLEDWFGLVPGEPSDLFAPTIAPDFDLTPTSRTSSKEEVAANIERFCEWAEKEGLALEGGAV